MELNPSEAEPPIASARSNAVDVVSPAKFSALFIASKTSSVRSLTSTFLPTAAVLFKRAPTPLFTINEAARLGISSTNSLPNSAKADAGASLRPPKNFTVPFIALFKKLAPSIWSFNHSSAAASPFFITSALYSADALYSSAVVFSKYSLA